MIEFTVPLRRHPSLRHEAFVDDHRNEHAPFRTLAEMRGQVRRTARSHMRPLPMARLPNADDGIGEIRSDDMAGLGAVSILPGTGRRSGRTRRGSSTCTPARSCCPRRR